MTSILIVHSSRHGHTAVIARRLGEMLHDLGAESEVVPLEAADMEPDAYDAVVVAGSIHMAHHDPALVHWVRTHRTALSRHPSAFLSVSLTAAAREAEARAATRAYIDAFVEDTGWQPSRVLAVAGALQYREYGFLTRQMIRQIAAAKGLSTDTSRDHEYTDWSALRSFAERFATTVQAARPAALV